MKVNIDAQIKEIKFSDLPAGSFFWHGDTLYLKPKFSTLCAIEFAHAGLAVAFNSDLIEIFDAQDEIRPETQAMEIRYKNSE